MINADRMSGQPETTAAMLADALAGRSVVDSGWWAELEAPRTDVARDAKGRVVGVVSHAVRPSDKSGFLLWLHGREDRGVLRALIEHTLTSLDTAVVYAFEFASALTLGLEGLPVLHRPASRAALEDAGFTGRDLWRYMHIDLPVTGLPRADHVQVEESDDPPGKRLVIRASKEPNGVWAEATIGRPVAGIGVLWWISVDPARRVRGLGTALLGSALDVLVSLGAEEAILFVDDDAPADDPERSRAAANRLYDRAGFREIDRLFSFTR
ncbi:GNAT family N-acetyltransferase [Streptomyces sp. URMC 129]|uniref:GNAT family N-acetyltransferase n=1 Tax=Streptomyces sp. URMC 129 TaxID=3423407 RepID=UPI003F1B5E98